MTKLPLLAGAALLAFAPVAHAALVTQANLFSLQAAPGATTTVINLSGIATPSTTTFAAGGYTLTFSGLDAGQGVVQGASAGLRAVPVAGVSNGNPTYLTGGFGSGQTTNVASSGNYLSTGGGSGTITITFASAQSAFALLWGSVDGGNQIRFNNATNDVLTGTTVQGLANGFTSNGSQGAGGSAYVTVTSSTTFTSVTLSSTVVSFEAAAFAGSTAAFVPEPMSLALVGAGLLGLGLVRRSRAV